MYCTERSESAVNDNIVEDQPTSAENCTVSFTDATLKSVEVLQSSSETLDNSPDTQDESKPTKRTNISKQHFTVYMELLHDSYFTVLSLYP